MATDRTLLILGMHRSGTSACTRLLNLCGASLPPDLLPANASNVTGYWEPLAVVALHDALLRDAGSAWDDPTEFPAAWLASDAGQGYVDRLADVLRGPMGAGELTVVKDPRACRLVPLWRQALAAVHRQPAIILMVRNPLEVAASLERRDGMPVSQAVLLWLEHVLAAEASTRDECRVIITYDQLLSDWTAVVNRVETGLNIALPRRDPEVAAEIASFLDPALRHERATVASLDERADLPDWVRRVYRWHERASVDPASAPTGELDDIRRELRAASVAYAPVVRWYRQQRTEALGVHAHAQQQIELATAREAAWQEQLAAWHAHEQRLEADVKTATAERDELQVQMADLRERLEVVEASPLWKLGKWVSRT